MAIQYWLYIWWGNKLGGIGGRFPTPKLISPTYKIFRINKNLPIFIKFSKIFKIIEGILNEQDIETTILIISLVFFEVSIKTKE